MALGKKNKDQRSAVIQKGDGLILAQTAISPQSLDPLVFWTNHPDENTRVDLNEFALGVHVQPRFGAWNGPFTGRPQLIAELVPHLRERLQKLSTSSVDTYINSLRAWWRLFDGLEAQASSPQGEGSAPTIPLGASPSRSATRAGNGRFRIPSRSAEEYTACPGRARARWRLGAYAATRRPHRSGFSSGCGSPPTELSFRG